MSVMKDIDAERELTLRRADAADAIALADLFLRARRAAVPAIPANVHTDAEVHRWMRDVVVARQQTWAVEDRGGALVAILALDGDEVDLLYVDPDLTGQGIGGRLLRFAQECSPTGLSLWAFQSNHGARRFYERHGFVAAEYTDGQGNEEQAPDVRYVWGDHD
jgi:GNAT superfamily N-acetyltransferase